MNRKTRILAKCLLLALVAYAFTGCTTGTAPTPEQLAAYNKLILTDYKVVKAIQKTP